MEERTGRIAEMFEGRRTELTHRARTKRSRRAYMGPERKGARGRGVPATEVVGREARLMGRGRGREHVSESVSASVSASERERQVHTDRKSCSRSKRSGQRPLMGPDNKFTREGQSSALHNARAPPHCYARQADVRSDLGPARSDLVHFFARCRAGTRNPHILRARSSLAVRQASVKERAFAKAGSGGCHARRALDGAWASAVACAPVRACARACVRARACQGVRACAPARVRPRVRVCESGVRRSACGCAPVELEHAHALDRLDAEGDALVCDGHVPPTRRAQPCHQLTVDGHQHRKHNHAR
eukprot:3967719-Pleurochrysis_carterae.AAC.1